MNERGANTHRKLGVVGVAVAVLALAAAGVLSGSAGSTGARSETGSPHGLWALAVPPVRAATVTPAWFRARLGGASLVVVPPGSIPSTLIPRVRRAAHTAGLPFVVPTAVDSAAAARSACAARASVVFGRCAIFASSVKVAVAASAIHGSLTFVKLAGPGQLKALAARRGSIVGIAALRGPVTATWQDAMSFANDDALVDFGVLPAAGVGAGMFAGYVRLVAATTNTKTPTGGGTTTTDGGSGGGTADTQPPTAPGSLAVSSTSTTAIALTWRASSDNVGVSGYDVYRNGIAVGTTSGTSYTFGALICGRSYQLSFDAFDAAGNRSPHAGVTASTANCATTDTQAPTTPASLRTTSVDSSSVSVAWNASTDNVGISGYSVYSAGSQVATTTSTSNTVGGLACGSSYSISVDAYDAAGNHSGRATLTGSTATCAPSGGGSTSTGSVYVSTGGSDSSACSQSAPCQSLSRAYKAAQPGQVVIVGGGTYPQQIIQADSSKTSAADVTFTPASGQVVTFGCTTTSGVNGATVGGQSCIDVFASHVIFDGGAGEGFRTQSYTVNGFSYQGRIDTEYSATDITFKNMDIGAVAVGSSNTTISHDDIGPSVDPLNNRQEASGTVWSDNLIHDFLVENGGHMECVTWDSGTGVTFAYNEFRSCAIFGIFAKPIENVSGSVDHNAFWNPRGLTTNDDVKVALGSGATNCAVSVTNNWISEGIYQDCPGASQSNNTTHPPATQPPSPIRP
jgi:chitodextrinase